MEWVETTGRTVEDALDAALDQLGVDTDDVEFEVVQEPKAGLLGRREARLRARVKPLSREKPGGERRRRKGREGGGSGNGSRSRGGRGSGGGSGSGGGNKLAATAGEGARVSAANAEPVGGGNARPSGSGGRRRRGGRGRSGNSPAARTPNAGEAQEDRVSEGMVTVEEQAEAAAVFTRGLVDAFGYAAEVSTRREDEDTVIVDVTGEELGLLVGPKGATLQAIEELVRTAVQRRTEGHGARIHVDVGGYRAKRREALAQFAVGIAGEVLEAGEERELEPMSASDRKVVHDAVAGIGGVETSSAGEEPRRRVVISPV